MNDSTEDSRIPEHADTAIEAVADSGAPETVEEKSESAVNPLEKAEKEAADYRDRYLRLAAEMENFRKRVARERQEDRTYA